MKCNWLKTVKEKIRRTQIKAALAINETLIEFYHDLGKMIIEKETAWGTGFLQNLSQDLRSEFPDIKGFSVTNLRYCRQFFTFVSNYPQAGGEITIVNHPQAGGDLQSIGNITFYSAIKQIPWGHIKLLLKKLKSMVEHLFT